MSSFFRQITKAINKVIWGSTRPRIKLSTLCNPKLEGSAGLPDFRKYHLAALLMRLVDWFHSPTKQWLQLENALSPVPLTSLPWICGQHGRLLYSSLPFLTQQFFTSWNRHFTSSHLTHRPGPMTLNHLLFGGKRTVLGCPKLYLRRMNYYYTVFSTTPAREVVCPGSLTGNWSSTREAFAQSRTAFEEYLLLSSSPSHMLSSIYDLLRGPPNPSLLLFVRAWETELGATFSEYK